MKSFDQEWNKVHQQRNWGKYPSEEVIRFVARNYFNVDRENTRILDLGCGTCANSWFLTREGFQTFAFDGSMNALKKGAELLSSTTGNKSLFQADAATIPLADNCMDAIIDSAAISANTVAGITTILREAFRILKPAGKIFSTGLFMRSMSGFGTGDEVENNTFRNITEGPVARIGTVHFFSREEIEHLWSEAGFTNLDIDHLERTDQNGKIVVSYFMATAMKN